MVLAIDCQIVVAVDMNLNFEERFEVLDIAVMRSENSMCYDFRFGEEITDGESSICN